MRSWRITLGFLCCSLTTSNYAMSYASQCVAKAWLAFFKCQNAAKAKHKRSSRQDYYKECFNETRYPFHQCMSKNVLSRKVIGCEVAIPRYMQANLAYVPNPKVIRCYEDNIKKVRECHNGLSQLKKEERYKAYRVCSLKYANKMQDCAKRLIKTPLKRRPYERPLSDVVPAWHTNKKFKKGDVVDVCWGRFGRPFGWYKSTFIEDLGDGMSRFYSGGSYFSTATFNIAELKKYKPKYPTTKDRQNGKVRQKIIMGIEKQFSVLQEISRILDSKALAKSELNDFNRLKLEPVIDDSIYTNIRLENGNLILVFNPNYIGENLTLKIIPKLNEINETFYECDVLTPALTKDKLPTVCQKRTGSFSRI